MFIPTCDILWGTIENKVLKLALKRRQNMQLVPNSMLKSVVTS